MPSTENENSHDGGKSGVASHSAEGGVLASTEVGEEEGNEGAQQLDSNKTKKKKKKKVKTSQSVPEVEVESKIRSAENLESDEQVVFKASKKKKNKKEKKAKTSDLTSEVEGNSKGNGNSESEEQDCKPSSEVGEKVSGSVSTSRKQKHRSKDTRKKKDPQKKKQKADPTPKPGAQAVSPSADVENRDAVPINKKTATKLTKERNQSADQKRNPEESQLDDSVSTISEATCSYANAKGGTRSRRDPTERKMRALQKRERRNNGSPISDSTANGIQDSAPTLSYPGATAVRPSDHDDDKRGNASADEQEINDLQFESASLIPIAAEVVPSEDDREEMEKRMRSEMEERVQKELDDRLRKERELHVVAEAVHIDETMDVGGQGACVRPSRKAIVLAGICMLIVVVAVIVGAVLGTRSPPPTEEFELMVDTIGDLVASDPSIFYQSRDSPQYAAMDWLANQDSWISVNPENVTLDVLVERYALAALYFATDGPAWKDQYSFLGNTSACEWNLYELQMGAFCENSSVIEIWLETTGLRGSIPSELALLSSLESINLFENLLSGTIPAEIFYLGNLTQFEVDENILSGSIPGEVGQATHLTSLWFGVNRLKGTIPEVVYDLTQLQWLEVSGNFLTGTLSSELSKLTDLEFLDFSLNEFNGTVPAQLSKLSGLSSFFISDNPGIVGSIPEGFSNLPNLTFVMVDGTGLTGSLDEAFCGAEREIPIEIVAADCLGDSAKVVCSCCNFCCDGIENCEEMIL